MFKVKSSPTYVINLLAREGVKLSDIEKENNYVSFAVSEADSKKTVNILKGYNREYEITARSGISHFAQEMFRRFAVWISVIVLVCGVCIYSLYSMDVKIYGLNRVNAAR